jgi:outer membrane protein
MSQKKANTPSCRRKPESRGLIFPNPRLAIVLLALLFFSSLLAHAADLLDIYQQARHQDPAFAAARHALEAVRQRVPQARAGLLPNIALSGGNSRNRSDVDFGSNLPAQDRNIHSWNWTLQLTQPILRLQNYHAHDEAECLAEQALAQFAQAGQELILRVAQAYFGVAVAAEGIDVAEAQLAAVKEQLAIAMNGFRNGTATVTDVHEAKSRVNLARAECIAALNTLEEKRSELEKIVGEVPDSLSVLRPSIITPKPPPEDARAWIDRARENHPLVRAQTAALMASEAAVRKNRAEHLPTLDLIASHGRNKSSGSLDAPADYSTSARSSVIGLQLNVPFYAGGATRARVNEAIAHREKIRAELESTRRQAASEARQAYSGISTGLSRIEALDSAVESGRSAVKGNRVGYDLGIRINIDVLNAEQQLYVSQRDLTQARYETLMQGLKLKAAAGILGEEDLEAINGMLEARETQDIDPP